MRVRVIKNNDENSPIPFPFSAQTPPATTGPISPLQSIQFHPIRVATIPPLSTGYLPLPSSPSHPYRGLFIYLLSNDIRLNHRLSSLYPPFLNPYIYIRGPRYDRWWLQRNVPKRIQTQHPKKEALAEHVFFG